MVDLRSQLVLAICLQIMFLYCSSAWGGPFPELIGRTCCSLPQAAAQNIFTMRRWSPKNGTGFPIGAPDIWGPQIGAVRDRFEKCTARFDPFHPSQSVPALQGMCRDRDFFPHLRRLARLPYGKSTKRGRPGPENGRLRRPVSSASNLISGFPTVT